MGDERREETRQGVRKERRLEARVTKRGTWEDGRTVRRRRRKRGR